MRIILNSFRPVLHYKILYLTLIFLDFALHTSRMALTELFSKGIDYQKWSDRGRYQVMVPLHKSFFLFSISGFGILSHQSTKIRKFFSAFITFEVHKPTFRTDYQTYFEFKKARQPCRKNELVIRKK